MCCIISYLVKNTALPPPGFTYMGEFVTRLATLPHPSLRPPKTNVTNLNCSFPSGTLLPGPFTSFRLMLQRYFLLMSASWEFSAFHRTQILGTFLARFYMAFLCVSTWARACQHPFSQMQHLLTYFRKLAHNFKHSL